MAITVLGKTFESEVERREYFREELSKKLPELKKMEGFPIGEDEDIIELSDPPYYTACPNPWLNDFVQKWEKNKSTMAENGLRSQINDVSTPYALDISEGKNNKYYRLHTYHTKVPHPAIMRYILHYTEPGDIIFDGFGGTGMTGVAAKECGKPDRETKHKIDTEFFSKYNKKPKWGERECIVSDLAPSATFISSNLNSNYNTAEVSKSLKNKVDDLYNELNWAYKTKDKNGALCEINYTVWSEVCSCPDCSYEFSLWKVSADTEKGRMKKKFNCPNCKRELTKKTCDFVISTKYDEALGETVQQKKYIPVLINYSTNRGRFYKEPDDKDIDIINRIKNYTIDSWYPVTPIMHKGEDWGDTWRAGVHTGVTHTHHFYTKRNLIFLSKLWNKLDNQEKFVATSILSRNLTKLNRYVLKPRSPLGEVNGPLSGTLYVSSEYVEQNPFDLIISKIPNFSWDNSGVVNSTNGAQSIPIANNQVDYIFTDPPFGSNIMYSELNFLWESWLSVFTNNEPEAIENSSQGKSTLDYQHLMSICFNEYFRILKPGKWMTVEFSNTSAAVWNGIQTAIQNAGFVVTNVSALDKKHGGIKSMTYTTSVKQDLIISCYKPSSSFDAKFRKNKNDQVSVWYFVEEHLNHLPIHIAKDNSTTAIIERSSKILFDRLVAFYVQKGLPVPIDASKFQKGLRERFIERDGMFFTNEQVQEYDRKKAEVPNFTQLSILVASEQDGVLWLQNFLKNEPKTYQDIQPEWLQALGGERKGDIIPELKTILEENFLKNDAGEWYVPDPDKEEDLEKLRNRRLLKQFEDYKEQAFKPKGKIKECRVEALRAGFKQSYQDKDFETIVRVGERIPENLLMEDEVLLQFYDIAAGKV